MIFWVGGKTLLWKMKSALLIRTLLWKIQEHLTACSSHVTYAFQSESTLYSCLNVKELLARSRHEIWSLSDCNWTQTQNPCQSLATWLSVHLRTNCFRDWVQLQSQEHFYKSGLCWINPVLNSFSVWGRPIQFGTTKK